MHGEEHISMGKEYILVQYAGAHGLCAEWLGLCPQKIQTHQRVGPTYLCPSFLLFYDLRNVMLINNLSNATSV